MTYPNPEDIEVLSNSMETYLSIGIGELFTEQEAEALKVKILKALEFYEKYMIKGEEGTMLSNEQYKKLTVKAEKYDKLFPNGNHEEVDTAVGEIIEENQKNKDKLKKIIEEILIPLKAKQDGIIEADKMYVKLTKILRDEP